MLKYIVHDTLRWIAVRIDMLSAMFSTAVAFYLIYSGYSANPSSIGFILTVAGE